VLQALRAGVEPADGPAQVLWVGGEQGMEEQLVQREGIPFESIPAAGVHGVGLRALPGNVLRLARGLSKSRRILKTFNPDVLFFTGGFVAAPMALAARWPASGRKRPRSLVYVPDIEPGWALRALARLADHVALTVEDSQAFLPRKVGRTVSGYPLRKNLEKWDKAAASQALGLQADLPVFLVWGGSKGARSINQALFEALPQLLPDMQVVHISGQNAWQQALQVKQDLPVGLSGRYYLYAYLHGEMNAALASADLVLSRAGASSLGEYPFFGLPAVLVPYPYAWRYQKVNADYLVQRGAAFLLPDADLGQNLLPTIRSLMADQPRRQAMSQAMRSLARPDAAATIAGLLRTMSTQEMS